MLTEWQSIVEQRSVCFIGLISSYYIWNFSYDSLADTDMSQEHWNPMQKRASAYYRKQLPIQKTEISSFTYQFRSLCQRNIRFWFMTFCLNFVTYAEKATVFRKNESETFPTKRIASRVSNLMHYHMPNRSLQVKLFLRNIDVFLPYTK